MVYGHPEGFSIIPRLVRTDDRPSPSRKLIGGTGNRNHNQSLQCGGVTGRTELTYCPMNPLTASPSVSDKLLDVLSEHDDILILMHDNPDPDAIASAWALQVLIEEKLQKPSRVLGGGAIVRAENRHMVDLLGAPVQLVMSLGECDRSATILVDCGSLSSNQLLAPTGVRPVAIIDHHIDSCDDEELDFRDLRPDVAATATIAASYLRDQQVEPGAKLATALLYAIRTETRGCETAYTALDNDVMVWLTERAEPELLAEIESAPLSLEWYSDLVMAMQCTNLVNDVALCFLPRAEGAEIVGEVADLLIRGRGIRRVLCAAVVGKDLLISVRTSKDAEDACALVVETIGELGGGGGHGCRAGGKILNVLRGDRLAAGMESEIRARWLQACGVADAPAVPLISRHEVLEHL